MPISIAREGRLMFTGHRDINTNDRISAVYADTTNDSELFSPDIRRIEIHTERNTMRLVTLAGITGILTWFAFQ